MVINTTQNIDRLNKLKTFQKTLGIEFKNLSLLDLAFHHRSYSNESSNIWCNNERLEFLGDAVLGMSTADFLYADMINKPEGDLAKIKSVVVSEMTLSQIALNIHVDQYLVLGHGEELSGGRTKKAILADAMEAIIGAYHLDSGYDAAEKLVLKFIIPEIRKVQQNKHHHDYKTLLQEYCQKTFKNCPIYELVKKTGPDHDRTFLMSVNVNGKVYGPEKGKNKKEAEQAAAGRACKVLGL